MKSVIFDIDDTLYMRSEPYLAAFHTLFGPCPDIDENALFQRSRVTSDEEFDRYNAGEISQRQMYINRGVRAFASVGIEATDEEAMHFQDLYTEKLGDIHLLPGMVKILTECGKRDIFMGLISNGQSPRQRKKARALHTERYFPDEHIMITGDIGIHKPDIRVFQTYAEKFELDPEETCYVGDNFINDVEAPHRAGWKTAWILRKNLYTDEEVEKAKKWVGVMSTSEEDILNYILEN